MTISKLVAIDFRRQWITYLVLSLTAAIIGVSVLEAIRVQSHLANLLRPPKWGAAVALLPKGVTLTDLNEDLRMGHARAVLPKVLFESLKAQVLEDQSRKGAPRPSLEFFAVLPAKSSEGQVQVMTLGVLPTGEEPWNGVVSKEWRPSPEAATAEWGEQVIEGIFATTSMEIASRLKSMADRRTVAQGVLIQEETEAQRIKAEQMLGQVWIAVFLVALCAGLTLLLSFRITAQQRKNLFDILEILGFAENERILFVAFQIFTYLVLPVFTGIGLAYFLLPCA